MQFLMIGGFLGAGKTTTIARLADHYAKNGKRVGIVTNDQAFGLVDTKSLKSQGFQVGEVPGACFCCKFDDLVETIGNLKTETTIDVIITEPVGSCTDLAATVIEPLRQFHGGSFSISPLAVLLKPEHGLKILKNEPKSGFSAKAAYIFLKQIEEADIVVLNKVDKLDTATRNELLACVQARFPRKHILFVSAKTGEGFDDLIPLLNQSTTGRNVFMEVDYDVYAEGEAEMGWLNASVAFQAEPEKSILLDKFAVDLLHEVKDRLAHIDAEPAHLKVLCESNQRAAIANLVGSDVDIDLSTASGAEATQWEATINARAITSPDQLEKIVRNSIHEVAASRQCNHSLVEMRCFRPGRPVPTHRLS